MVMFTRSTQKIKREPACHLASDARSGDHADIIKFGPYRQAKASSLNLATATWVWRSHGRTRAGDDECPFDKRTRHSVLSFWYTARGMEVGVGAA
jgi:hypothetical protein